MKNYTLSIFCMFCFAISAQDNTTSPSTKEKTIEAFISYSFGFSALGAASEIEDQMRENHFTDDHCPDGLVCSREDHPRSTTRISYELDMSFFLNEHNGFSLGLGKMNSDRIIGFDKVDLEDSEQGNRLEIHDRTHAVNLNYVYRTTNSHHFFYIGPSLIRKQFDTNISDPEPIYKLGGHIAYQFNFGDGKVLEKSIRCSYRWFSNSRIGPYSMNKEVWNDVENRVELHSSTLDQMTVSNQSFNIHFVLGININ